LEAVADGLEQARDVLISLAEEETGLPSGRLSAELTRTTFQLKFFGDLIREGTYLDVVIDHADDRWPAGAPRADIRRYNLPIGPVLVFSASNFPFAFSVAGGDTASALAAGCPVVVKAHPGHPQLSEMQAEIVRNALESAVGLAGVFSIIYGQDAGVAAVTDPSIKAVSFTGSYQVGRMLYDLAMSRDEPIPFYGELGSTNPVFVTEAAAHTRGGAILEEFAAAFTLGGGQYCTKPGMLIVPRGESMAEQLVGFPLPSPGRLLTSTVAAKFTDRLAILGASDGVEVLIDGRTDDPMFPRATVLKTELGAVIANPSLSEECFGPASLIVEYADFSEVLEFARRLRGQLAVGVQGAQPDAQAEALLPIVARVAGRVVWNAWPPGVSVTYAQNHGGPYPSTTSALFTAVGSGALARFVRPVAFQNVPDALLPDELQEANPLSLPRRVDGAPE
jgi:NADP-dependent aldehyde dehydrogenase